MCVCVSPGVWWCYVTDFRLPGEVQHKRHTSLLTPEREPTIDQNNEYTSIQYGKAKRFYGGIIGSMVKGSSQEQDAEDG